MKTVTLDFERALWRSGIERIAGVDEAGRGPLAGPVVAAAVIFLPEVMIDGVNDSKKISERKREELYAHILEHAAAVGVGVVDHTVIDRMNILQATHLAMKKALEKLSLPPHYALIDGTSFHHPTLSYQTIVQGDAISFTIAAASIIAKVTRDRMMREYDKQFPHYGFAQHKGYGTRLHREAIIRYGLCPIHRRTFCKTFLSQEQQERPFV